MRDWKFDMPIDLACKVITELDWMVHNHVLEDFTCKQLMDIASGYLAEDERKTTKLSKAKSVIKKHLDYADCGIYNTSNTVGDEMETIYEDDELIIDICYGYCYYEVFGLSEDEFEELKEYYNELRGWFI